MAKKRMYGLSVDAIEKLREKFPTFGKYMEYQYARYVAEEVEHLYGGYVEELVFKRQCKYILAYWSKLNIFQKMILLANVILFTKRNLSSTADKVVYSERR